MNDLQIGTIISIVAIAFVTVVILGVNESLKGYDATRLQYDLALNNTNTCIDTSLAYTNAMRFEERFTSDFSEQRENKLTQIFIHKMFSMEC